MVAVCFFRQFWLAFSDEYFNIGCLRDIEWPSGAHRCPGSEDSGPHGAGP